MNFQRDRMPDDIRGYHQRTKHAPNRYALGPAFLDWTSQPSPYRLFEGSRQVALPLLDELDTAAFPGPAPEPAALDRRALGLFLELAFGLSAWKTYEGSTWALRNNPSSGNLHPTESYVVLDAAEGVGDRAALYHYAPLAHALEERATYEGTRVLPPGGFALALASIPWREAWKYGERAFRYCQLDAGHAIGAVAQAAAALGWRAHVLSEPSDEEIAALLGLYRADSAHRREAEHPDLLLWISTDAAPIAFDPRPLIEVERVWQGTANRLSEDHDGWPLVDLAVQFCRKERTRPLDAKPQVAWPTPTVDEASIGDVVRGRRSAQRMDGETELPRDAFVAMLAATLPGDATLLLAALPWTAALTLVVFVHRVEGVEPGLYVLQRNAEVGQRLRAACSPDLDWLPVDLDGLSLFRLRDGDVQRDATRLACLQAISGKGCFSLAMIADFDHTLEGDGGFGYRRLHWEAGVIGQALYLYATACGFAGTGIGCFFDDEVHGLLGLPAEGTQFQDIYHFTVGAPVEDTRILTLPPYPDERRERR